MASAKFDISSFNHSRDMEGVSKFHKVGHVTPFTTLLELILHFFVRTPSGQSVCQI